jgi:2,5-diketo-D-gluconate reductase B
MRPFTEARLRYAISHAMEEFGERSKCRRTDRTACIRFPTRERESAHTDILPMKPEGPHTAICSNGLGIPCIGFGTYGMQGPRLARLIAHALRAGFRHIDTAQIYGNEEAVGEGVLSSGVRRDDVFITTKVWVGNYPGARFEWSVDESLKRLRMDYVDLLLLHWPSDVVPLGEQIGALNELVRAGKALGIGVSNFNSALVQRAANLSDIPLATNQFEYHPYLNQASVIAATERSGASITAYCAMAVGRVFSDPVLKAIAARYGKSVSQVVLRWLLQQPNVVALSRTEREERIQENVDVFDFVLDEADMSAIFDRAAPGSRIVDPPGLAPQWDPTPANRRA